MSLPDWPWYAWVLVFVVVCCAWGFGAALGAHLYVLVSTYLRRPR